MRSMRMGLVGLAVAGLVGVLLPGEAGVWLHRLATLPVLLALLAQIVQSLRRGEVGLDLLAALSMAAALGFGEELAANVVALMYAGGQLLEDFAEARAGRDMTALLERVPRFAMRQVDGKLEEVPIQTLAPGEQLLIRTGEVLPVDGLVREPNGAVLEQSAITGEAAPVRLAQGSEAQSGASNAGDAFHLEVLRPAAESTYARIVHLVSAARASKSPVGRLADRFALVFLAVTLVLAGLAWWLSGDPVRAVAVLVVATPCPLILALPVALISGVSRAARHGVLVKTSGALERLWTVRTAILDKTGTLTQGGLELRAVEPLDGFTPERVLHLAASLDQASNHVTARALVRAAEATDLALAVPEAVEEAPGEGVVGSVLGHRVAVGGRHFVARHCHDPDQLLALSESGQIAVAVDGRLAGLISLADGLRPEVAAVLEGLRRSGIARLVLASGDRQTVAETVTAGLGLDLVRGELQPDDKLELVAAETRAAPTLMVGDGVNDAPALAAATVGIAMGARGTAASAETADIVILVDAIDRLLIARRIALRTRQIALQSVVGGLVLSLVGMLAAAFGLLSPVAGALLQEAIDVAVILNALRALSGPRRETS